MFFLTTLKFRLTHNFLSNCFSFSLAASNHSCQLLVFRHFNEATLSSLTSSKALVCPLCSSLSTKMLPAHLCQPGQMFRWSPFCVALQVLCPLKLEFSYLLLCHTSLLQAFFRFLDLHVNRFDSANYLCYQTIAQMCYHMPKLYLEHLCNSFAWLCGSAPDQQCPKSTASHLCYWHWFSWLYNQYLHFAYK